MTVYEDVQNSIRANSWRHDCSIIFHLRELHGTQTKEDST